VDGNGRLGRMLMNKILIAHNMLPMIIFHENRTSYFKVFETPGSNHSKYYQFMLEQYMKSIKLLEAEK
jgi:Fic family protein